MSNISRRRLMSGLVGATCAGPILRFFTRTAEAETFPTRFLFVYTNAGRDSESRCTGSGAAFTLGAGLSSLEALKSKVLIVDGLRIPAHRGEEHPSGKAALLTARPANGASLVGAGISFDRYLAGKIGNGVSFYAGTSEHGQPGDIDQSISWNAAGTANQNFSLGSTTLLKKLFGASAGAVPTTPEVPAQKSPSTPSAETENEIALYDHLMKEVQRMSSLAPKTQVEKLELHLQSLTQLKSTKLPTSAPGMGPNPGPAPVVTRDCSQGVNFGDASSEADKLSMVIAHGFACGRARVGVLRIGGEDPYHGYSHWQDGADYRQRMRQMDKEWAGSFAKLLRYLDSFKEGAGSVLDNTVVVWGSDCCGEFGVGVNYGGTKSQGEENGIHGTEAMPFVLAGKLAGKLKAGQRVTAANRTNLDLYRTIAQQMGVAATDFGDNSFSSGPLQEILA